MGWIWDNDEFERLIVFDKSYQIKWQKKYSYMKTLLRSDIIEYLYDYSKFLAMEADQLILTQCPIVIAYCLRAPIHDNMVIKVRFIMCVAYIPISQHDQSYLI